MRSELALVAMLAACGGNRDEPHAEQRPSIASGAESRRLDTFALTLPDRWTSRYDAGGDRWLVTSPARADGTVTTVTLERAPAPSVAGPDALRHHMLTREWPRGTTADIEKRKPLPDGFATLLLLHARGDAPAHRELHVVRELGSQWFRCIGTPIVDDPTHDAVLSLCRSLKRS